MMPNSSSWLSCSSVMPAEEHSSARSYGSPFESSETTLGGGSFGGIGSLPGLVPAFGFGSGGTSIRAAATSVWTISISTSSSSTEASAETSGGSLVGGATAASSSSVGAPSASVAEAG